MNAEHAYLFRHAVLRDAAYQLQLPGDRAWLHAVAFEAIEGIAGGRPPEPPPLEPGAVSTHSPHPADVFAEELAGHARLACNETTLSCQRLYLRRAAEIAEHQYRNEDSARLWEEHAGLSAGAVAAECLRRASIQHERSGRMARAIEIAERGVATARTARDVRAEGVLLGALASYLQEIGRWEDAEAHLGRALHLNREAGNTRSEAGELSNLALIQSQSGREGPAERHYEEALALLRGLGDLRAEAIVLIGMATVFRNSGRGALAEQVSERALAIFRESGDRRHQGIALGNLAVLRLDARRIDAAEAACREALEALREVGDRRQEGVSFGTLAGLYYTVGRDEAAVEACRRALEIDREVGNRRFESIHLCLLSLLLLECGTLDEAREAWRQGAAILRELGDAPEKARQVESMREACAKAGVPPFAAP